MTLLPRKLSGLLLPLTVAFGLIGATPNGQTIKLIQTRFVGFSALLGLFEHALAEALKSHGMELAEEPPIGFTYGKRHG
jgi:hypothetical protein